MSPLPAPAGPRRVLLADDHDVIRHGLRAIVEAQAGWTVCAEAATGREAVALTRRTHPHVVVMDISMPDLNGLEATRQIRRTSPQTEVLILTMHESNQLVREVLDAGARGFVRKQDAVRVLVTALEALGQHKPFLTAEVSELVLRGYLGQAPGAPATPANPLTPRERELVQLLAEGHSNKEAAAKLAISVKTAETHRANIMRKLRLRSLSALVRYAIRNRIIEA